MGLYKMNSTEQMENKSTIFRVSFLNDENIYEIYARKVCESDMFGFLMIEDFVFGENSSIVVDPSEEKLKLEFKPVKRTYIPMHSVLRIDEVEKEGTCKMKEAKGSGGNNISHFPKRPVVQPENS